MAKELFATTDKVTVTRKPITTAPAPQMVRIYHNTDGSFQDVFPVDAKEIVAQGEYSYDAPSETTAPSKDAALDFESMTKAELQEYADLHNVQVTASMSKAEMVEAVGGK